MGKAHLLIDEGTGKKLAVYEISEGGHTRYITRMFLDGVPYLESETTTNDSDKTITVSANERWEVRVIRVKFIADNSASNRRLAIRFTDDSNVVLFEMRAGVEQALNTTRYYHFGVGLPDMTAWRDSDLLTTPIPAMGALEESWKIRVWDKEAQAVAADDMEVYISGVKWVMA